MKETRIAMKFSKKLHYSEIDRLTNILLEFSKTIDCDVAFIRGRDMKPKQPKS